MRLSARFLTTSILGAGLLMVSGCEFFEGVKTLNDIGRKIDPVPGGSDARAKPTEDRPAADNRGVISYPTYKVIVARRDDTMAQIAARVGMSPEALAKHNGLSTDHKPRAGEVLALPSGVGDLAEPTPNTLEDDINQTLLDTPNTPAVIPSANGDPEPVRHVVETGETAYTIARLYNVSVTALASWNGLDRNLSVREGQQLLIPVASNDGGPVEPVEVAAAEAVPRPNPTTVTPETTPAPLPPSAATPLPKAEPPVVETVTAPAPAAVTPVVASNGRKLLKPVSGSVIKGFSNKAGGNEGIDFGAPSGTSVKAAENGTVALISKSVSDTTIILIRHPDNLYTVYSNVGAANVSKGDKVSRGQSIGKVAGGSPPFLHFEVRKGTEAVDPAPYL